jgi:hypothetical protein
MAYNRQPNVVLAGTALKQNPPSSTVQPAGIVPVTIDADIATYNSLGVVQIGSGINVDANGVISANQSAVTLYPVKLVDVNYNVMQKDYYIGATEKNITITLPLGLVGKVFVVKNQSNGTVRVEGSLGETLDGALFKTLGTDASLMALFDGFRWNLI